VITSATPSPSQSPEALLGLVYASPDSIVTPPRFLTKMTGEQTSTTPEGSAMHEKHDTDPAIALRLGMWQNTSMLTMPGSLTGVGYQGFDVSSFSQYLTSQAIDTVVDVRLNAISRKAGFSKRALAANLEAVAIDYIHIPALGNPKPNRAGFGGSEGQLSQARLAYRKGLEGEAAAAAIEQLASLSQHRSTALMCFEADQSRCHRDVAIQEIAAILTQRFG
jgi:hypothetical protein